MSLKLKIRSMLRSRLWLLLLIVPIWFVYCYLRQDADYYWQRAQRALARNDDFTAEIYLRNLVQLAPDHSDGHALLYETLKRQAQRAAPDKAENLRREAKHFLLRAAELAPAHPALQEDLFVLLADRQSAALRAVAKRLVARDPNHEQALLVLARHAVSRGDREAKQWVDKLLALKSAHPFEVLSLALRLDHPDMAGKQVILGRARYALSKLDVNQFNQLVATERTAIRQLLLHGIAEAADLKTASDQSLALLESLRRWTPAEADASLWHEAGETAGMGLALWRQKRSQLAPHKESPSHEIDQQIVPGVLELQMAALKYGDAPLTLREQCAASLLELNRAEQALEVARGAWPAAKPDLKSANQAEIRICFLIARCCLQLQRGEEAQRYLTSVCHPRQPDETLRGWAHLLLGTIESGKQNPAKALVHYEQAKRALGHNLFVDACFAELECQRKRWHAAIPYLQRVKGKLAAAGPAERQWVTHRGLDGPKLDWWLLQASLETDQLQSALEAVAALRNTTWAVPAEIAICLYLWDHRQQSEALRPVVEFRRSRPEDPALFDLEFRFRLTLRPIDELDGIFLASPPALQADDSWYRLYSTWNLIKATSPEQVRNQAAQFSPRLAEQPTGRLARTLELVAAATKRSAEKVGDKKVSDEKSSEKKNNEKKNVAKKSSDPRLAVQVTRQTEQQTSDPDLRRQSAFALASLEFAKTVFALQIDQQDYCSLALRLTESAFREQPTEALLRQQISKQLPALFTNKMHQATVEELDCFLKQYPLDPFLVGLHAEVLLAAGESKLALETLDGLVNLLPDSTIPRIRKAQILFQMDQLEEALCELEPVLARSPDHHGARLLAAKVAFKLRRFPAARDWAAETLKDEPSAWPLYLIVAECYRQEKRLSEALAIVEELIEKRPQYLDAHRMRVLLTHDSQGPVTALQLCHQVQTIFPGENKLKHDLQQLSKLVEKSPSSM